jgi:glycerol-3-phosphate dehydrogenase (NAD(P)+)
VHLARVGHDACLWGRDAGLIADMRFRQINAVYLPDVRFPSSMRVTHDMAEALDRAEVVVMAAPSHGTRDVARLATPLLRRGAIVVSATKGLEQHTLYRVSEILEQELGPDVAVAVLSGPSFASELARELPTAVSVASRDAQVVEAVQAEFRAPVLPALRHERRGRRRNRRRAQERDCHCGGARRGSRPWPQRAGGADHARARRDLAPGLCRGRAA